MFEKLKRLFRNPQHDFLVEMLSKPKAREDLLGTRTVIPPTDQEMRRDSAKVVNYANSDEYQVWAEEAWFQATELIQKILDARSHQERDQHCGALSQTLELLRVSAKAKKFLEQRRPQAEATRRLG
jgi:hypothetical protein